MAKRKRRSTKASDPLDPTRKKRAVPKERGLIEGDAVDGLAPPNHMLPAAVSGKDMFPLMGLKIEHNEDSRAEHAFVHPRYGDYYWGYWNNTPPSWMDPMLLADMARKDEAVKALLAKAVRANKKQPYLKQLSAELERVFEEVYLPWLIQKFGLTQDLVAEWLIANAADRKLQEKERAEEAKRIDKRRRRKRSSKRTKPEVE
jgi:hypothetical protein